MSRNRRSSGFVDFTVVYLYCTICELLSLKSDYSIPTICDYFLAEYHMGRFINEENETSICSNCGTFFTSAIFACNRLTNKTDTEG